MNYEEKDDLNFHNFKCEECDEEGILGLPKVYGLHFSCPTCGTSYIQWGPPSELQCIATPLPKQEVKQ